MKTLIAKELRENLTLAAASLVILVLLLVIAVRECTDATAITRPIYDPSFVIMQPLMASFLLKELSIFCACFGALLGWLQIHRERPRDLWAFLIHRPLEKSRILQAKLAAGMIWFCLVAGAPLALFVVWVRIPGHVAAPFEWPMLWPVTSSFLLGVLYYLAGMLVSLRPVRWYGSRGLPLVLPVLLSFATMALSPAFGAGLILAGLVLLAAAVWGSFLENGSYGEQPGASKAALLLGLSLGNLAVVIVATGLIASALHLSGDFSSSSYQLLKDGRVVRWVHEAGQPGRYLDLNGQPSRDLSTGHLLTSEEISPRLAAPSIVNADFQAGARPGSSPWNVFQYFTLWRATDREVWFYWVKHSQLVGFDLTTRRLIGSLGPSGFAPQPAAQLGRFRPPDPGYTYIQGRTLHDERGVYRIITDERKVQPLLTTLPEDPVAGATDLSTKGEGWDHTLVATKRQVLLVTPDAKVVFKTSREAIPPDYTRVSFYALEAPHPYALWWSPRDDGGFAAQSKLPARLVFLDAQGAVVDRVELPALPPAKFTPALAEQLVGFVLPPCLVLPMKRLFGPGAPAHLLLTSLTTAVICMLLGAWIGSRFAFSARAQVGWALFHLLFSIAGLLAFLAARDWPAREPCPICRKRRAVDRDRCEHCAALFPPPAKTGTEIFA